MIDKSQAGTLTDAELLVLQSLDLAMLSRCEQAKNLTITLLKKWHSHGRKIGIKKLKEVLKLKIEDYSTNHNLRTKILSYSEFMLDFMIQHNLPYLLHSRCQ